MSDILSPYDRVEFLKNSGWSNATESPVGEDWSQRKIFRVERKHRTAILMHAVPDDDPRSTPGHALKDFITISNYLRHIECSAPVVYAQDLRKGLLLVEDFGRDVFADTLVSQPEFQSDLYNLATRTLIHLYHKTEFVDVAIPDYFKGHIHKGRSRVVDWYMPAVLERRNPDGMTDDFMEVLKLIEKKLPPVRRRFLHADYHLGNLMWLPARNGIQQTGLVDFQGALMGPAPYDLVNLLDDARRVVPEDIREHCLDKFYQELKGEDADSFRAWYPVLACHFHCRVIGQAIKLAVRNDKTRLMDLIPILRRHLRRDLDHPILAPLKRWFKDAGVDFSVETPINLASAAQFIRSDAF